MEKKKYEYPALIVLAHWLRGLVKWQGDHCFLCVHCRKRRSPVMAKPQSRWRKPKGRRLPFDRSQRRRAKRSDSSLVWLCLSVCVTSLVNTSIPSLHVYINIWVLRHFHVSLHFGGKCHRPSMFPVSLISLAAFNVFLQINWSFSSRCLSTATNKDIV